MPEIEGYHLPDDLYYHPEHMWVRKEGDIVRVGLNDFSQKLAGELSFIELPETETEVSADQVIGSYETGKWMGKIYAPCEGRILEVNEDLEDEPELVNEDPYGKGWIFTMEPGDMSAIDNLIHGDSVADWIKSEAEKNKG
ncbi:glycine cleavage system protein GcvH [candidate division WOR-3 bacterium]|uniref:Glycine cleavage system H protein n=1 Tax=candidate division WOR-3 bacterium TaxID=2052148 RepID=A0A9D5KAN9_UNCW3|nr:glycine cleavage system protein GcvH [candidate division WOR-3 bacterium]MBD3365587.1 glycine cleavage system protein GcvH [candidate division WOR-3 bacterium]